MFSLLRLLPASRSASSSATSQANMNDDSTTSSAERMEFASSGRTSPALGLKTSSWPSVASLPETRQLVVMQALDHLFKSNYFDICKVRQLTEILQVSQRSEAFALLHSLHCVSYADMKPALRNQIPHLVNEALRPPEGDVCEAATTAAHGLQF